MADNQFAEQAEALFRGMNAFVSTKTVVGAPQQAGDAIIIPLVDVSCGMATGAFSGKKSSDGNGAGGMSTKISPAAVLIIQNGATRLINVKNQDAVTRVMDLVPDVINRFTANSKISPEATERATQVFAEEESEAHYKTARVTGRFFNHHEKLCSLNEVRANAGSANIHLPHATFRLDLNGLDVCLPDAIASSMRMAHVISEVSGLFANSTLCHGNTSYLLWTLWSQSPYRSSF